MKTIILFAAIALSACNSIHSKAGVTANKSTTPTPANVVHQAEVPRVTTTELDELMKQGKVVVVDVRTQDMYDKGHIRGAKLIPVNQIGERGKELPRDKKIVTYCS
jgi:phage shock protein E